MIYILNIYVVQVNVQIEPDLLPSLHHIYYIKLVLTIYSRQAYQCNKINYQAVRNLSEITACGGVRWTGLLRGLKTDRDRV